MSETPVTAAGLTWGSHGAAGRGSGRGRHRFGRGYWQLWLLAALVVAAGGAAAAWMLARPHLELVPTQGALAKVEVGGVGGRLSQVDATLGARHLPLSTDGGRVVPKVAVAPGSSITVEATLHEPGWISWITGQSIRATERITAPAADVVATTTVAQPGHRVTALFDVPVAKVAVAGPSGLRVMSVDPPSKRVAVAGLLPATSAGEVKVAGVANPWESFPHGLTLTYFVASEKAPMALIPDGAGAPALTAAGAIDLKLSVPVSSLFGTKLPTLAPTITGVPSPKGTWTEAGPDELVFTPSGPTFWPGEQVTMTLPSSLAVVEGGGQAVDPSTKVTLNGPPGSLLRMQQMLASLNYLPVAWTPAANAADPATVAGQAALMNDPQPGAFSWRWAVPSALTSQWAPDTGNVMTTGAVMSFEDVEGLTYTTDPLGNPLLWPTLIKAFVAKQVDPRPYVWVEVSKTLPERLWLWVNGRVVITSLANTGIPSTPTTDGTFAVYLRYQQNYMSGHNPTGSYYHDLVHWIAYFKGSEAVHGFPRASYGFPQSLGCVELPVGGGDSVSHQVWPYDRIGTLVTILPTGAPTTA